MNRDLFPFIRFLSEVAGERGHNIYIVGGAVRNFLLGCEIKDIDLVVDSVALEGYDSEAYARDICERIPGSSVVTNQYGVSILTVDGNRWGLGRETVEIATARKESYGGAEGKGYKPHMVEPATIKEDLLRREFTFNTLLWRLSDLKDEVSYVEHIDLLGVGRRDLNRRQIACPVDPDKTFTDDPTRMLRAVKFACRYAFSYSEDVKVSITKNARALTQMPWDAVRKIVVEDLFLGPNPVKAFHDLRAFGLLTVLRKMCEDEPNMASAISRAVPRFEVSLQFLLADVAFPVRIPYAFLTNEERAQVNFHRAVFPEEEKALLEGLLKPQIRQEYFFSKYDIPVQSRGEVMKIARKRIVHDMHLASDPEKLMGAVESVVSNTFPLNPRK